MKISVAIMAHKKRKHFIPYLQEQLPGAEVVWDRKNDRWDTGSRSMAAYDPSCDWHVVVQDDALLCRDFLPGIERALLEVPDCPASFYTGKVKPHGATILKAEAKAREAEKRWLRMMGPLWGVAVAIPTELIDAMLAGCSRYAAIKNYDMRMATWFASQKIDCWHTIPSLVDHRVGDENPSLVPGRSNAVARTALDFLDDKSPLDIDWSTGAHHLELGRRREHRTKKVQVSTGRTFGYDATGRRVVAAGPGQVVPRGFRVK